MAAESLDGTIGTPTKILILSEETCLITLGTLLELMHMVLVVEQEEVHLPLC